MCTRAHCVERESHPRFPCHPSVCAYGASAIVTLSPTMLPSPSSSIAVTTPKPSSARQSPTKHRLASARAIWWPMMQPQLSAERPPPWPTGSYSLGAASSPALPRRMFMQEVTFFAAESTVTKSHDLTQIYASPTQSDGAIRGTNRFRQTHLVGGLAYRAAVDTAFSAHRPRRTSSR